MSRVLNRPMFRLGGSTSGITSGLDTPKRGRVDGPGGYAGIDYDKAFETEQRITDKYYPRKGADINRFLIDWGLNMVGNPPSGNVLQTAAKQAQGPTKELFENMDRREAMRSASGADLFGKIIAAEGEAMGGAGGDRWRDEWALNKVKTAYKDIYLLKDELKTLDPKIDAKRIKDIQYDIGQAELDISQLQKDNPLLKTFAGQKDIVKDLYDAVTTKFEDMREEVIVTEDNIHEMPKDSVVGQTITREKYVKNSPELVAAVIAEIQGMFGGTSLDVSILLDTDAKATGGRVGYQGGELVEEISTGGYDTSNSPGYDTEGGFETAQIVGGPQPGDTSGSGAPVVEPVGMSFEELRARLPATITDDIVILLSQSGQALEDFATIQTQQDVDNFNTKYNVNLILPSEG
jgi:hypothetical protein